MANDASHQENNTTPGSAIRLHEKRPAALSKRKRIAGIDNPELNAYKTKEFSLKTDRVLRVYALGRGKENRMLDWGGIEDRTTGQMIWIMRFLSTRYGGGHNLIRQVDRLLPLKAGSYRLHFKTGPVPPSEDRDSVTRDPFYKGIWLFDDTRQHTMLLDCFWETSVSPETYGWSKAKLNALMPELARFGTDAVMVVTNGKVIFQYGQIANVMRSHSIRKSLLSGLYGIYTANGKISLDATLGQLGIEERPPLTEQEKQARILDLIKARSGVYIRAAAESDAMQKARPPRGAHTPGTFWYYNNWDFNVLGTVFRQETGQDLYQAFKRDIADPIGMQDFILDRQAYHYEKKYSRHPAYPFLISARDLAKFGQLFLRQGVWNSRQIIPADWVQASTASYSQTRRPGIGYGYMWWVLTDDLYGIKKGSFFADGFGGQRLWVMPHLNTVIVHRIDITIPGTNAAFSGLAPDAVTKRIMTAYSGDKKGGTALNAEHQGEQIGAPPVLDRYGRSPAYYGKSFTTYRTVFWICGVIFISSLVFRILFLVGKFRQMEKTAPDGGVYPAILRWAAALGGLICAIYIYLILTIPYLFEHMAMVGMPSGLTLHQTIIFHIPKFSVAFTIFLLIGAPFSWARQYWHLFERIYFMVITFAAAVFTALALALDLIILV